MNCDRFTYKLIDPNGEVIINPDGNPVIGIEDENGFITFGKELGAGQDSYLVMGIQKIDTNKTEDSEP